MSHHTFSILPGLQGNVRCPWKTLSCLGLLVATVLPLHAEDTNGKPLPGTAPLTGSEDLSERMAAGISDYYERLSTQSVDGRASFWKPDFSSPEAYTASVQENRKNLSRIIGAVDERVPSRGLDYLDSTRQSSLLAETPLFSVRAVRWPVLDGIHGEGLLLQPKKKPVARIVVIPDADQTPEALVAGGEGSDFPTYARRLAEQGFQVVVPALIDRTCDYSGNAILQRQTNQTHREWIYRQAYTFGRHIIGYEVQKILAVIDWFEQENSSLALPVGVAGWGEGGLLALYSAAVDERIDSALVSGYFDRRERLWTEPLYRNLFGLLREFGDAEIAQLVLPRSLLIEHSRSPQVDGPPPALAGVPVRLGASAAAGRIATPAFSDVSFEVERLRRLAAPYQDRLQFFYRGQESDRTIGPLDDTTLTAFVQSLLPGVESLGETGTEDITPPAPESNRERQHRQVTELERHLQDWIDRARAERDEYLWKKTAITTPEAWDKAMEPYRNDFIEQINGKVPSDDTPMQPRSRLLEERDTWQLYEVTLDVAKPDLFVWGYLLLPKNIPEGEKRPVIVAQHGGGGVPQVVINEDPATNRAYKAYAVQLAERGYVVFAPHFPWRTTDRFFRLSERKANPVGQNTFAVIFAQHEKLIDWLVTQPWVDADKIGFYGLSWGGKVAMRVPAVEKRYALSICSGDFNEWTWKCATTRWGNSYMYVPEYETLNFDLGGKFSHAEMAAMIAPRPFMVERGHDDGVGIDEWVAFEYARVNRLYSKLKIPERTEIEFFNGGHEIHAKATFDFLQRQFQWPKPAEEGE